MSVINIIQPTYSDWKAARTFLATTTYYVQHDFHYLGILIQLYASGTMTIYLVELTRTPQDLNTVDFEANVKGTATHVVSLDDAIQKVVA